MRVILLIFLFYSSLLLISCDTTETPPDDGNNQPDTTSQNFTFETYEFGDGGESSLFNDVWIFDENNIWAVGYIGIKDSEFTSQGYINPNIMRWTGSRWKIMPYSGTSVGIEGIWAIDSSHIYFADGLVFKYDEGQFVEYDFRSLPWVNGQRVEKLWGSGENNIWGVGPFGTIVHFDGTNWSKIDFDTGFHFYDITGIKSTGRAFALASTINTGHISIVKLADLSALSIYESQNAIALWSIDYINDGRFLISGEDIWEYLLSSNEFNKQKDLPSGYGISCQAISSPNDIYFFGDLNHVGSKIIHFNGIRYKTFDAPYGFADSRGGAMAIKDIAAYGCFLNNRAHLIIVRRK